jgi:hypothetical protein
MSRVPVYTAIARFQWGDEADATSAGVVVLGNLLDDTEASANPLSISVPLAPGISRWDASEAVGAALHENGWRVAGRWDRSSDVAWAVAAERVVTCVHCRKEIWWRVPARLADQPGTLGGWCDDALDDTCAGTAGHDHEPRRAEGEQGDG